MPSKLSPCFGSFLCDEFRSFEVKVLKAIAPSKKVVFSDEILQDPYPTYTRLLEEGPLHYVDVGS